MGKDSDGEDDDLQILENIINEHESEKVDSENEASDDEFEVMGQIPKANWVPSEKIIEWYLKVADLELSKEVITTIQDDFKAEGEIDSHFQPPKFPDPLWSAVNSSSADTFRLKYLYKTQENLY